MLSSSENHDYFTKILIFLKKYQWLYNYSNVDILNAKYFNSIPHNWIEVFQSFDSDITNDLITELIAKTDCPLQFREFLTSLSELSAKFNVFEVESNLVNSNLSYKVHNEKKWHEIKCLANVVNDICRKNDIDVIIDVGAGLGYITFLLYENFNYKILAVEGNPNFVSTACKYQNIKYPASLGYVKFVNHFITSNSTNDLEKYLYENFSEYLNDKAKVCIIGLHACADLSVTILKVFSEMKCASALAIMPCCYHRLTQNEEGLFYNFPASNQLKLLSNIYSAEEFLKVPFLRLACQQTDNKYKKMSRTEMQKHSQSWMLRAVLQSVAEEEKCTIQRLKRKSGKIGNKPSVNFVDEYISNIPTAHKLVYKESIVDGAERLIDETVLKEKFIEKWSQYEGQCGVLEFLSTFQTCIQSLCENLLLLDRVQFLKENGIIQCSSYKVSDDRISPRCHGIIAFKN